MNKVITSIATLAIVGSVNAENESFIYHGFEKNNPDLYAGYSVEDRRTAVQPGIGDSSDRSRPPSARVADSYGDWVANNPDGYSGIEGAGHRTAVQPGVGDFTDNIMKRRLDLMRNDSYDAWVAGNPDQESGVR